MSLPSGVPGRLYYDPDGGPDDLWTLSEPAFPTQTAGEPSGEPKRLFVAPPRPEPAPAQVPARAFQAQAAPVPARAFQVQAAPVPARAFQVRVEPRNPAPAVPSVIRVPRLPNEVAELLSDSDSESSEAHYVIRPRSPVAREPIRGLFDDSTTDDDSDGIRYFGYNYRCEDPDFEPQSDLSEAGAST